MKILVVGSGGREHALVWKIAQSKLVTKIFCAPGNGGIARLAECIDISAEDIPGLLSFALKERIDLTVVGPEAPLVAGIADEFSRHKLKIFGPQKKAAQLEASKVFSKQFLAKYKIPSADFRVFENYASALGHIKKHGAPCVVKADGLAQGKGVVVAKTIEEAEVALSDMMQKKIFGPAGERVIIEDCLEGQEASILVFCDGKNYLPLASSQDHKRVFDQDKGPNTGGMGAYSPAPVVTDSLFKEILDRIVRKTIDGLSREGIIYKGVLYSGIMITRAGPQVLEFNVRFGDPETQAIFPRLNSDLVQAMSATIEGELDKIRIEWKKQACVCVVCASGGYPGNYAKAKVISGISEAEKMKDIVVFHAGTKSLPAAGCQPPDEYITNGGRVLGVAGLGDSVKEAIVQTYKAVEKIHFAGMHFRRDIGFRAMAGQKLNTSNNFGLRRRSDG